MREEDYDLEPSPFSDPQTIMKRNMSLQWALQDAMQSARGRGEFASGVHSAAEQLDQNPDDVVLCILVDNKRADPGIQVHCRLIEAFCWEFPIPVIKVDSSIRLMFLAGYSWNHPDTIHCVLIKGKDSSGPLMEKLLRFSQQVPAPLLKLA
ncbi:uncharacterized protein LOC116300576 [Actinia tenebrosa]|uniref:Uncharacterized protein LOC116300576 n=1 Tax=Actinia tenebrosa TaxID=6105 RepID=A0A6P8ICK2_ACTTE|nr:uncharacterized protein LOC116300576 [Actinia tenebrosa]